MDIRNIQKTGDMHYVYLPTSWCKEHKIASKTKVSLEQTSEGVLIISPGIIEKKPKHLKLNISEDDEEIIHKLIVASYINPASSFEINMDKEMDLTKLLNQKRLISLESVEIDKKQITSDGAVTVADPDSLLKTMVKKIRNLIIVMEKNPKLELVSRYEDEIDRSKMLIEKSVIGSMSGMKSTKLKTIDLYYISLISKELERMVDRVICLKWDNGNFLGKLSEPIELLHDILQDFSKLDQKMALEFAKKALIKVPDNLRGAKEYDMHRIKQNLITISEVVLDWMITTKLEN
jgi:phosphate uptake regulator